MEERTSYVGSPGVGEAGIAGSKPGKRASALGGRLTPVKLKEPLRAEWRELLAQAINSIHARTMPRPRLPVCTGCRERHLRCDRASPACSNCSKANPRKECVFERLEIRHSSYTLKAKEQYNRESGTNTVNSGSAPRSQQRSRPSPKHTRPRAGAEIPAHQSPTSLQPSGAGSSPGVTSIYSSGTRLFLGHPPSSYASPGGHSTREACVSRPGCSLTSNSLALSPACFTTRDQQEWAHGQVATGILEQRILEFYIKHAGPWLDIASSCHHFGQTVPRLARREPVLYLACLAYASHVLALKGELDKSVHDEFQNRAIGALIPLLSPNSTPTADKTLLATGVILRMSEQFSEIAEDAQHHLRGAYSLFTTAQEKWSPSMTDLGGVAFWTYVRESIRVCFLNEQGVQFDLDTVYQDSTMATDAEEVWANRISHLLARMCDACWGNSDPDVKELARTDISIGLNEWRYNLPETFQPWYFSQEEYEPFPVVKFLSPWHEISWQQFYTARAMAAAYSPKQLQGSSVVDMNRYLESEILQPARVVCSVCLSSDNIGCNINGAHLMAWCGQFFTGREEQKLLAKFLDDFARQTCWPNKTCCERLQQIWSGRRRTWTGV